MAKKSYLMLGAGVVLGALAVAGVVQTPGLRSSRVEPYVAKARPVVDLNTENLATLHALDESFAKLAEWIEPAVVLIRSEGSRQADLMGRRMPESGGSGSGVIFRPDGWIVTNDHVVNGFEKVTVVLADGREFPGKVTRAEDSDIALVKIEAKELPTVQFADSDKVRPGQFAIAVGSPFGFENSVTIGHVSALNRRTEVPDARMGQYRLYSNLIQTDASINMGNSGGPLLNVDGQVIGINTAIFSGTGGSVGIGFAIPANQVRLIAETLIEKGKITRGFLGLEPVDLKEYQKKEMGLSGGAFVKNAPNDQPAAIAGIKAGDVVVKVGDVPVKNEQDLRNSMLRYAPGQVVKVEYVRDGQVRTSEVRVAVRPKQPGLTRQSPAEDDGNEIPRMFRDFKIPEFGIPNKPKDEKDDVAPLRAGPARLGVTVETINPTLRKQFHVPESVGGAVVTAIEPGSVAEQSGLKVGDVILEFDGKPIKSNADLRAAMGGVKWGDSKQLKSGRYGENSVFSQDRTVRFR